MNKKHALVKSKIAKEMCLRLALIIVLPVTVIGIFLLRYSQNTLRSQSVNQVTSDNIRVRTLLTDCLINTYNLSDEILNDDALLAYLTDYDPHLPFPQETFDRIETMLAKNTSVSYLHIYTTNPLQEACTYLSYASEDVLSSCFQKAQVPAGSMWGLYPGIDSSADNPELTLVRSFPVTDPRYHCVLAVTIDSNYLRNRIQNNPLTTMISVNDSNIFFSTIRSLQETPMPGSIDYSLKYYRNQEISDYQGRQALMHTASLPIYNSDDVLYICTVDFDSPQRIMTVSIINSLITFGVIAAALSGIILYASYFSKRILSLRTSMKAVKEGNYSDVIDSLKGDDELTETFEDLTSLINDIKEKDALMYESRIKEQALISEQTQMRYRLLSNQINPHFLYNTLETIRMLALEADAEQAANATMLLAKTMRYVLDSTLSELTTLDQELDYVDTYLQIQQLRFSDRLESSLSIAPVLRPSECRILPLLLQPLVENAVRHGMENGSRRITIQILVDQLDENTMRILVADNGSGISGQKLHMLHEMLKNGREDSSSSIGLCNIQNRIQLLYGAEYGLSIQSAPGQGTQVTLTFPLLFCTDGTHPKNSSPSR